MKRVLFWLILLGAIFGILTIVGMNRDSVDPFLQSLGIDTESGWFEEGFKFVLYIIVGGPILGLMTSIFSLGQNTTSKDVHGYTILRLKAGVRYFLPIASIGLAVLMYFASADSDQFWVQALFTGFAVAFLLGGWAIFRARIRFDGSKLFVRGFLGGEAQYEWGDLERIENASDSVEYRLKFRGNRTAKISHYYAGVDGLVWLANEKRRGNARTA